MDNTKRNNRLRQLVRKHNKHRKKQAQQIDILCNDIIATHRDFIKKLDVISFAANFYESIIGTAELGDLLHTASKLIEAQIPNANIAFFLRQDKNFKLHLFQSDQPIALEKQHLENHFTSELVNNVCMANKVCTLDSLLAMGLQVNPSMLNKISVVTVPLSRLGTSLGFILIYRSSDDKLTSILLNNVLAVTSGLSQAIQSCRPPLHVSS